MSGRHDLAGPCAKFLVRFSPGGRPNGPIWRSVWPAIIASIIFRPLRPMISMTHDYKRNGTTTLFAALDLKTASSLASAILGIARKSSSASSSASTGRADTPQHLSCARQLRDAQSPR